VRCVLCRAVALAICLVAAAVHALRYAARVGKCEPGVLHLCCGPFWLRFALCHPRSSPETLRIY
jgi:hypothetical protein